MITIIVMITLLLYLPKFATSETYLEKVEDSDSIITMNQPERCEPIVIPLCEGIQYNTTILPNLLGHTKQETAGLELHQYMPLVKIQCSPNLQIFLCSIYVPICSVLEEPIPPCRSLCLSARNGCESLMNKFGFNWPDSLDCNKYPIGNKGRICVGDNNESTQMEPIGPIYQHSAPPANVSIPFKCPAHFKVPPGLGYSFRLQGKMHKDCGMPCDDLLFESNERNLIRIWTGAWAVLCVISTAFTIITFYLEPDRFNFPERSIIFLSCCYFFIGLVFIYGFFFGDSVACNDPFPSDIPASNLQMVRTITQGNRKEKCTLSFMALYFFTMSNSIWWVILTVTWFLTAALKWGQEPVEAKSHCFHLLAWAISAVMTIIVLAVDKIEGDFLTGVCFISNWNPIFQLIFVLIPLGVMLIIGFLFLISGFISLLRTRSFIKQNKNFRTKPMDRQMVRIGGFSILYLLPSIALLTCFYYEQKNIDSFLLYWLGQVCKKLEYGIPCPAATTVGRTSKSTIGSTMAMKPPFILYFIKYFCWLMPGISSSFWIWSEKTVSLWTRQFRRLFCLEPQVDYV